MLTRVVAPVEAAELLLEGVVKVQQESDGLVHRQLIWEGQRQLSQGLVQSPATCLHQCITPSAGEHCEGVMSPTILNS